jgi:hypothetical protein
MPLDPTTPQEQALLRVLAITFDKMRLDHLQNTAQAVTIYRKSDEGVVAVTVAVEEGFVMESLDEWGAPVALTPSETAEALQRAADGSDESGI